MRKTSSYASFFIHYIFPLFIYCGISTAYFGRLVILHLNSQLLGGGIDPAQFVWFLYWWPFALQHHLNPFISYYIWAPGGYNMVHATAVPLLSLLTAPITKFYSPIVSYNLLGIFASSLSAWTAYLLCKNIVNRFWPALFAGYFFGFSDYQIAHSFGDLNLAFTCLIPLLVYLAVLYIKLRISNFAYTALNCFILISQALISLEIFATFLMFACLALFLALLFFPHRRIVIKKLMLMLLLAYLFSLFFLSPYLYFLFTTPHVSYPLSPYYYTNDLASFFVPNFRLWLGGGYFFKYFSALMPIHYSQPCYLGIPLILLLVFYFWSNRHNNLARLLITFTFFAGFMSLGSYVKFHGHILFLSPVVLLNYLPFLNHALPMRFSLYMYLSLAIIIALWLQAGRKFQLLKYIYVIICIFFLLPNFSIQLHYWRQPVAIPTFFSSQEYQSWIKPHDNVLILPQINSSTYMLWQLQTHMYFNLSLGYAGGDPTIFANLPLSNDLLNSMASSNSLKELQQFILNNKVNVIILDKKAFYPWKALLDKVYFRHIEFDGLIIYKVNHQISK